MAEPFYPFKAAKLNEKELRWFSEFSCRRANCFKPAECVLGRARCLPVRCSQCTDLARVARARSRAFVLGAIREEFGSEDEFDHFVRTHLPDVLARSKREYQSKLFQVAKDVGDLVFGA